MTTHWMSRCISFKSTLGLAFRHEITDEPLRETVGAIESIARTYSTFDLRG